MNIASSNSELRRRNQPKTPASPTILPDDLIPEILCLLDVKSLLKLRCVCKSWKSLISDPIFVQMHLKRSQRNPQLALYAMESNGCASVLPFPICRLLDNPLNTLPDDPCYRLMDKEDCDDIVGSCNGLICLKGCSSNDEYTAYWFCLWNPATRQVSKQLGYFRDYHKHGEFHSSFNYMFGYDNSTCTYKLVAVHLVGKTGSGTGLRTDLKVLSLGDNVWRVIQSLPLIPYILVPGCDVDFRGSLNWLALLRKDIGTGCIDLVINSFDLPTETYTQFLPPPSFVVTTGMFPHICVSVDCLCFSHDVKRTHLVIWKMAEFGVHESWTQILKISYQNLDINYNFGNLENQYHGYWVPLHIDGNHETVIFSKYNEDAAVIYNWRENMVKKTRITQKSWWHFSKNYAESLVSPSCKCFYDFHSICNLFIH